MIDLSLYNTLESAIILAIFCLFYKAFQKNDYKANYYYCYCTKSNHFSYVLDEVLSNETQLETSSSFDIDLLMKLYAKDKISKKTRRSRIQINCFRVYRNEYGKRNNK